LLVTKARNKIPPEAKDNWVDYNLNRKKAVNKKLEAAERDFTVKIVKTVGERNCTLICYVILKYFLKSIF
jgi:hypothetical protein